MILSGSQQSSESIPLLGRLLLRKPSRWHRHWCCCRTRGRTTTMTVDTLADSRAVAEIRHGPLLIVSLRTCGEMGKVSCFLNVDAFAGTGLGSLLYFLPEINFPFPVQFVINCCRSSIFRALPLVPIVSPTP